jgi:hypothetical protein
MESRLEYQLLFGISLIFPVYEGKFLDDKLNLRHDRYPYVFPMQYLLLSNLQQLHNLSYLHHYINCSIQTYKTSPHHIPDDSIHHFYDRKEITFLRTYRCCSAIKS